MEMKTTLKYIHNIDKQTNKTKRKAKQKKNQ